MAHTARLIVCCLFLCVCIEQFVAGRDATLNKAVASRYLRSADSQQENVSCCSVFSGCINNLLPTHHDCIETLRPPCDQIDLNNSSRDCTTKKACGTYLQGPYGVITSRSYPNNYPNGLDCSWHIQVSEGERIQLQFRAFHLEEAAGTDYLMVFDGPTDQDRMFDSYYGVISSGFKLISSSNHMYLVFHTDKFDSASGFNITYQELGKCLFNQQPCGLGELGCFDASERCNGVWECPLQGGDEYNCRGCQWNAPYPCGMQQQCYRKQDRCDGIINCSNHEDELNCPAELCGRHNGTFLCKSGKCIYESLVCNGVDNCYDYSDERNCSGWTRAVALTCFHSLTLSLLLIVGVIALSCRLYKKMASRWQGRRRTRHRSLDHLAPVAEIQQEIMARRSAPPQYDVAMETSRPFHEVVQHLAESRSNSGSCGTRLDLPTYSDTLSARANVHAFLSGNTDVCTTGDNDSSYVVIEDGSHAATWCRRRSSQAGSIASDGGHSEQQPIGGKPEDDVDLIDVHASFGAINWGTSPSSVRIESTVGADLLADDNLVAASLAAEIIVAGSGAQEGRDVVDNNTHTEDVILPLL